jgi:small subunit ribosomal protein S6
MPLYETVFITRQDLSTGQNEELANTMKQFVTEAGGKIANTEFWGLRQMAYKINKNKKGHYTLFHIDGPAGSKDELERNLRINEDVLRFMTVKIEKLPEGQSALLRKDREPREEEGVAA